MNTYLILGLLVGGAVIAAARDKTQSRACNMSVKLGQPVFWFVDPKGDYILIPLGPDDSIPELRAKATRDKADGLIKSAGVCDQGKVLFKT